MPKEYDELLKLDYPEQVVKQIYHIEKQIDDDLALFDAKQWIEIGYEDFCRSPKEAMEKIRSLASRNGIKIGYRVEMTEYQIPLSRHRKIDEETFGKLRESIADLDWQSDRPS